MSSSPQPLPRPVVTSPRGRRLRALHGRALALAAAVAGRLPPVRYSRWGLAAVAVLGVLGILNLDGTPVHLFDLDAEGTVPAAYSAGLLVAAGAWALVLADGADAVLDRRAHRALGVVFLFMALDEALTFHERAEWATGVDWQILYIPIVAAAVYGFAGTLRVLRRAGLGAGARALVLGAVCWVVAQGFEATQYAGDLRPGHIHAADLTDAQLHAATTTTGYYASMVSEELLEMSGSLCFGIAALIAVRALLARRASDA